MDNKQRNLQRAHGMPSMVLSISPESLTPTMPCDCTTAATDSGVDCRSERSADHTASSSTCRSNSLLPSPAGHDLVGRASGDAADPTDWCAHHSTMKGVSGGSGGQGSLETSCPPEPWGSHLPRPTPGRRNSKHQPIHLNKLKPQPSPACRPEHTKEMSTVTSRSP